MLTAHSLGTATTLLLASHAEASFRNLYNVRTKWCFTFHSQISSTESSIRIIKNQVIPGTKYWNVYEYKFYFSNRWNSFLFRTFICISLPHSRQLVFLYAPTFKQNVTFLNINIISILNEQVKFVSVQRRNPTVIKAQINTHTHTHTVGT